MVEIRRTWSKIAANLELERIPQMMWSTEKKIIIGFGVVLAVLLINALVSYRATRRLINQDLLVSHTHDVLGELEATISTMKDAETGERGYIITGEARYLQPYESAVEQISNHVARLQQLTADTPSQQARIPVLKQKVDSRLNRLKNGIELRGKGDVEGTRQIILSGEGKLLMDDLRQFVSVMENDENALLAQRSEEARTSGRYAFLTDLIPNLIICLMLLLMSYILTRDITARKRAEEALRQQREWLEVTLSSIGDAVIATDIGGAATFLNPVAQALTGWKQTEAAGQPLEQVFKIVNEETRQPVENPALRAMKEGIIVGLANHTVLLAKDGTEVSIDDSGAPIKDSAGKTIGAVVIFRDITERRRAEKERSQLLAGEQAARERAEEASRAKDEFVAMISHEIRSPLTAILGWAQLLRRGTFDESQRKQAVETIERNARTQVQLVEDLLDISRVITGKLRLNVRPVEITQIIEAALHSIRPAVDAKEIQLQAHLERKGSLVSGDPDRLQQVFWNLFSNAVKFTPKHGSIEVTAGRINSHIQITVSDSGAGISADFLPYVFDRFSQANITSERKYGGLGLGLAIVRHLMELHGGSVRVESAGEGQGATFMLTFPVRVVHEEVGELDTTYRSVEYDSFLTDTMLAGLRVMIVDDEPETRDLLTAMLTQRGAEVKPCASASDALATLVAWHPDVLV